MFYAFQIFIPTIMDIANYALATVFALLQPTPTYILTFQILVLWLDYYGLRPATQFSTFLPLLGFSLCVYLTAKKSCSSSSPVLKYTSPQFYVLLPCKMPIRAITLAVWSFSNKIQKFINVRYMAIMSRDETSIFWLILANSRSYATLFNPPLQKCNFQSLLLIRIYQVTYISLYIRTYSVTV